MSLYDLPVRRRRHRGPGRLVALVAAAVVAAGGLYVARDAVAGVLGLAPQPAAVTSDYLVDAGGVVQRAACVDPTGSSAGGFATGVLATIGDGLAGWAGPQTGDLGKGLPARPGLRLVLRTVSTTSEATEGQVLLDRTVDAVPGLAPPPDHGDPGYATERQKWDRAAAARRTAWQAASTQAATLGTDVKNLVLDRGTSSAISGCLAAAAQSTDPASDRSLMLASDLIENEPPTTTDYGGSPVLLVWSCPAADTAGCPKRVADWTALLTAQKAGPVHPVRADAATDEIEKWVRGS